jgi:uncharacterized protein involved in exopolysaccharide biosynthesis
MENIRIEDILAIAKRRWWVAAIVLLLGAAATAAYVGTRPSIFRAQARIIVESQLIPDQLARSTVDRSVAERIELIRQRLFTRQNLLEIAREQNVFPDVDEMSPTDIVNAMRSNARINGSAAGQRQGTQITGVNISFSSRDPQTAARVANELVSRVLQQNVQQRTSQAQGTLAFFNAELERLAAELDAQSRRIAQFQLDNQNALPGSLAERENRLAGIRQRNFERSLEREALAAELTRLREQVEIGATDDENATPRSRELDQLRTQLILQQATLNDTHPTIRRLQARIQALETMLIENGEFDGVGRATRQLARIEELEQQLERIDELDRQQFEQMARLEDSIARTPEVALALDALRRDYAGLQDQYSQALAKQAQASTGERLESTQQAERFEIIEQALPPEEPVSPNRRRLLMAGFAASGALGFGLVVLLEMMNRGLRTSRDFERQMDILPIGVIPYIPTRRETLFRQWAVRTAAIVVVAGSATAVVVVDQLIMPLPLVMERLSERLGI